MKRFFLIDANSLIHRCFHALPPFASKDGMATGALYGLASVLLKIFREQAPDYVAAFFVRPERTFRKEMFEEYKAHRPKAPNELVNQIIEARKLFSRFGVKIYELPGFEADDLIGTVTEKYKNLPDLKIVILTGDLDAVQLVENDKVVVETFKKGISETIIYNEEAAKIRFGVLPKQMPDYKSLVGDPSDNILGVHGIGPKTAAPLIQKYGNLENLLEKGQKEKAFNKIKEFEEQARLSKILAQIHCSAPLELNGLDELKYNGLPKESLSDYFEKLGFKTLINRINSA